MGDDHGWHETAYNGHPYLKTPVLDDMAKNGLRFDRFYSASPLCSPTRGSVMTGRHPNRYGTFGAGFSIRPEEITIAHVLREAGYACGHFGKWHLGPVKADSPTNPGAMGFETWLSHDNFFELNPRLSRNGAPPEMHRGESSEILVDEALKFIARARASRRPFFVVIWFGSPHEPYQALQDDLELYADLPDSPGTRQVRLTSTETGRPIERLQRDVLRERFAEITAMDRAIGTLRTELQNRGLRDNTLLWYCGDNGTPKEADVGGPFRGHKSKIYNGGLRVPAVIEWPARIRSGRSTSMNTVTSDILPTLAALTGQALHNRPLDGIDLSSLLEGGLQERTTPIYFWHSRPKANGKPYLDPGLQQGTSPMIKLDADGLPTRKFFNFIHPGIEEHDFNGPRAVLDGRYKLVIDGDIKRSRELFDVQQDPAEATNIIDRKRELAARLERDLRAWQQSVLESLMGRDYRHPSMAPR